MKTAWIAVVLAASVAAPGWSQGFNFLEPQAAKAEAEYQRAQKSLDQKQYEQALQQFQQISDQKGAKADAALYWKAYTERKLNQVTEALKSIEALQAGYPSSRWINDAKALQLEIKQMSGQNVSPESTSDEDLKLMAINGLMHTDPEKAFPILEKLLKGTSSPKVKERALFVLAQSGSEQSRQLLVQVAKGGSNPDLQRKAINSLGMAGPRNGDVLAEIYSSSTDPAVKKSVLRAYLMSGDTARVSTLARGEKDPELRKEAIQQLGMMGDRKSLYDLYSTETDAGIKKQIIKGLFISGDSDKLGELVKTEKDPGLRKEAIQALGLTGRPGTGETLAGLYATESDLEVKKQVLNSLFVGGQSKMLVDLARKESNVELKKTIVRHLSHMQSKESTEYMMELLNK